LKHWDRSADRNRCRSKSPVAKAKQVTDLSAYAKMTVTMGAAKECFERHNLP
jgi:hypothetical protein